MPSVLSPETLRSAREALGMTMEQAAYRAGCSVRTLSRAELGESVPRVDLVGRLAELYGVPVGELFHDQNGSQAAGGRGQIKQGGGTNRKASATASTREGD